jgi:hypothetical protein
MLSNKPSKELLVDLVNKNWSKAYSYASVTFENLEIMPYDHDRNTGITIKSTTGTSPLAEPKKIYYDRLKLTDYLYLVLGDGAVPAIEDVGFTTTAQVLPAINALLGIQLTTDDIIDEAIADASYPRDVILRANPGSLVWLGQLSVTLKNDVI